MTDPDTTDTTVLAPSGNTARPHGRWRTGVAATLAATALVAIGLAGGYALHASQDNDATPAGVIDSHVALPGKNGAGDYLAVSRPVAVGDSVAGAMVVKHSSNVPDNAIPASKLSDIAGDNTVFRVAVPAGTPVTGALVAQRRSDTLVVTLRVSTDHSPAALGFGSRIVVVTDTAKPTAGRVVAIRPVSASTESVDVELSADLATAAAIERASDTSLIATGDQS